MSNGLDTSLFDTIKNLDQMGFDNNDNLNTLDNNLGIFKKYTTASLSGNSTVFNDTTGKQNRYFKKTGDTCINTNGTSVNRNILVDNMNFVKTGSSIGLLPSAMNDINKVDFSSNKQHTNCVPVTIITDATENTDTDYVSIEDYRDIDCSAFPKNCKPVINKNTNDFNNPIICEKCASNISTPVPTSDETILPFPSSSEGFTSYHKCKYCDNSIHKNILSDYSIFDNNNRNSTSQKKHPAVTIYITTISILGLFILYKMLYVKHT